MSWGKAKTTSSNSVRVYVHYRVINDSLKDKFGILDFKAHCPFKNELSELKGGFVVTNLGPEENEESENLWYFPQGCWDKVQEVELHWKKLPWIIPQSQRTLIHAEHHALLLSRVAKETCTNFLFVTSCHSHVKPRVNCPRTTYG